MLTKIIELLSRIGIVRLLIASKAFSSLVSGYIASRIRSHSKRVYESAKFGEDKTIEVDGLNIHYVESGAGPPLILLPGAFSTYRSWNRALEQLAPAFRVLAIDFVGAGSSDKPRKDFGYTVEEQAAVINRVIEKLKLGPVCLAGVSYGGSIALSIAALHPANVKRVVCIEGGIVHPRELPAWVEDILGLPIIGDIFIGFLKINIFNRLLMKLLMGKWYPSMTAEDQQTVLEALFYDTAGATRISWYGQSRASKNGEDAKELVAGVSAPVIYLYGKQSVFLNVMERNVEYFQNHIPDTKVVAFDDGIHDLHLQKSSEVADIIREFCYGDM